MNSVILLCTLLCLATTTFLAATITSNGTGGGDWASTTTWQGGLVPLAGDSVVILAFDSVHVLANSSCAALEIQSGGRLGLFAKLSATEVLIGGNVSVHADTLTVSGAMNVLGGGVYHNARNGGRIPTATWAPGSLCLITDVVANAPGNGNQNFHHITWNCTAQTASVNMGWNNITIGGNITVVTTNAGRWQLAAPTAGNSATITIMGDLLQLAGNFTTNGTSNGATTIVVNHHGNVTVTGGNFSISRGSQGGTGTSTWNMLNGNFTMLNATTQNSNPTGAKFVFASQAVQTLALVNMTFGGGGLPIQVDSGTTLRMGTSVLRGSGNFTLNSGATLECGNPGGLDSTLAVTGTSTLSAGATYVFNGTSAQVTGTLLPASINNLTINNADGVTLSDSTTLNGVLTPDAGTVTTGANVLALSVTGTVSRTNGHVFGLLQKDVPTGTGIARTFEIGSENDYTPVGVGFADVSTAGNLVASTTGAEHPNIGASGIDSARNVNRYWSLTNNGVGFTTYDAVFNFVSTDIDPGSNADLFVASRYSGGLWSGLTEGTRTPTSLQIVGATSFSDFAIGQPPAAIILSNGTGGGDWANTTTWQGGVVPGVLDSVVVLGTDSVFVLVGASCSGLLVQSGGNIGLAARLSSVNVGLDGKITVHADTLNASGAMSVGSGGTYHSARNGGRIPTASWASGSTCLITGVTANAPGNGNQNFHHVVWDCPAQTANVNMGWNNNTVAGNITVLSTNTGRWQLCAPTAGNSATVTIMGDVVHSGGNFTSHGTGNANTTIVINHHGDIDVTGGNFSIARGSQGGTGTTTWNLLGGDFTMANATTQNSNVAGARFVMAGTGPQSVTFSNDSLGSSSAVPIHVNSGSITTLSLANINYASRGFPIHVNSGAALVMGSTVFAGNGTFVLDSAATFESGHVDGINGNLATSGAKTLSKHGRYVFNGTLAQVTGSLLPDSVDAMTINNSAGLMLSDTSTATGTLHLTNGPLTTGTNIMAVGAGGMVNRTGGHVNGFLRKTIASPADSKTFEIGDASVYSPVEITGTAYTSPFDVIAVSTPGDHPNIVASMIDSTQSVNRYYNLAGTPTGVSGVTFNFVPGDIDAGANPANFIIGKYDGLWGAVTVGIRTSTSTQALGVTSFSDFAIGAPPPPPPTTILSNGTGGGEWTSGLTWAGGIPPGGADSVMIVGTDSVYVNTPASCASLSVQSGAKFGVDTSFTVSDVTVDGKISVSADTLHVSGAMNVNNGGVYQHARNGGRIPSATWGTGSTCMVTGVTTTSPSNGNQDFHHIIWNSPDQTANLNMGWDNITIAGSITVLSTGLGRWQMTAPTAGDTSIVTIMGNVLQSAGQFTTNGTSNSNTTIMVHHHGDITVTGGNFAVSRGSQGGTGTATWNLLGGNFTMSNATSQNSNAAGAKFVFAGSSTQTMALSSVTFAGGGLPVAVNSGAILSTGASVIRGSGAFTVNPGATLVCGHAGGIDSTLQNTGAKYLSTLASYEFNAAAAQVTGTLLPDTLMRLRINNAAGVTLSSGTTVDVTLTLLNGDLNLNGNTVTLSSTGTLLETPGNTVTGATGTITTTRVLSAPSDTVDIAGLGVRIGSAANLGSTVVTRSHAPQTPVPNHINRYFDVAPTNNTGLNATFRFRYDESELNGGMESALRLFRSTDNGNTWTDRGGAVDTAANLIMLTGVDALSRWTAASVILPPLPAQIILVSPAHGATISADSALCTWQRGTPQITAYWFERASDSLFTVNRLIDSTLTDTNTITRQLVNNQTYWWRVRAKNAAGWGPFSSGRRFIAIISGLGEFGIPAGFSLMQNYPNPFNPSTSIVFSVENTGRATVELFNIIGQKVLTLFDGIADVGRYHTVTLDGSNLPSGMYFYRLQNAGKNDMKKLILLK